MLPWDESKSSRVLAHTQPLSERILSSSHDGGYVSLCNSATLPNGDTIYPEAFVVRKGPQKTEYFIARIKEIIADCRAKVIYGCMVQEATLGPIELPYRMPKVTLQARYDFVSTSVSEMFGILLKLNHTDRSPPVH